MDKKEWKAIAVIAVLAFMIMGTAAYMLYIGSNCVECEEIPDEAQYNSGYLQGIKDVFSEAYTDGITMIPFNDTHSMALVPWERQ